MKKTSLKAGAFAAVVALVVCLTGCGSSPQVQTYSVGDTVETDVAELTLDSASLSIAISDSLTTGANAPSPIEQDFGLPVEYDSSAFGQDAADKGHTFVCVTYTVKNLDRTDKIIGSSRYLASVEYNGEEYESVFEGVSSAINTRYALAYNNDTGHFYTYTDRTRSNVVAPDETETIRAIVDIPVEIENLASPFKVTFSLPESNGESQAFTFSVN